MATLNVPTAVTVTCLDHEKLTRFADFMKKQGARCTLILPPDEHLLAELDVYNLSFNDTVAHRNGFEAELDAANEVS